MKTFFARIGHYLALPFVTLSLCWSLLRARSKAKKYRREPRLVYVADRFKLAYKICKKVLFVKNINLDVLDFEDLPTAPKLFIGNHKSNADPIIMVKVLYESLQGQYFTFLCKKELANNKWVKAVIDLIDGIYIDRNDPRQVFEIMKRQKELISKNYSLIIFPEGTRTYQDDINEYKSGAFKIAFECFIPIVNFTIYGSSGRMDSDKSNRTKGKVIVKANKIIRPQEFITANAISIANKLRDMTVNTYRALMDLAKKGSK